MTQETFELCLWGMIVMGVIVFVCLHFINAGYGMMISKKWGWTVPNRIGWVLMECPVLFTVIAFWAMSDRTADSARLLMLVYFCMHYIQRSFIFPFLMKGNSRMPIAIMLMGVLFNLINGAIQGYWIFFLSPRELYSAEWIHTPQFIIGMIIFFTGMAINLHSDNVIRNLRKPGDTNHYLPTSGMYRYVTSANYFGELVEWIGWAILTWSFAGFVFAFWTFANLAPRAHAINKKYKQMFPIEMAQLKPKAIIPFIY